MTELDHTSTRRGTVKLLRDGEYVSVCMDNDKPDEDYVFPNAAAALEAVRDIGVTIINAVEKLAEMGADQDKLCDMIPDPDDFYFDFAEEAKAQADTPKYPEHPTAKRLIDIKASTGKPGIVMIDDDGKLVPLAFSDKERTKPKVSKNEDEGRELAGDFGLYLLKQYLAFTLSDDKDLKLPKAPDVNDLYFVYSEPQTA